MLPSTMQVIAQTAAGGVDTMQLSSNAPLPEPKADDVLIKVAYAGVNRPDVAQRSGMYAPPANASPIMGLEASGYVAAVGANVSQWRVGDAICALTPGGGYAQYCIAPAAHCLPIPKGLTLLEAAALPENFFTVWVNVFDTCKLKAGESLLVHGGSSGIGLTAIQLALAFGATAYTTVGNDAKAAFCKNLGAIVFNYNTQDWAAELAAHTEKRGVNVILDMVGGSYIEKNLRNLALEGRYCFIAFLQGGSAQIDFRPLMMKRQTITGSTLRARPDAHKAAIAAALKAQVWPLIESGKIKPTIHATFPLAEVAKAHALMESSAHIGKIMLVVGGE